MTTTKQIDYLLETNDLNESIELLKHKYLNLNEYFTEISAGSDTLISLNPFKQIPGLFSLDIMNQYDKREIINTHPHLFKYAQKAFHSIMDNEIILVTGESGSGKTMSVNYLMSYFAHITTASNGIESMLLLTNPILEAFGNASTSQNENSSRFGKYIELKFNTNTKCLSTVKLVTCLLEKTRSTINIHYQNTTKDRNFHIFYQMISGADEQERVEWHLPSVKQTDLINKIDVSNWFLVKESMQRLKLPYFNDIFKLISCLYHLNQNNNNESANLLGFETSNELNTYLDFQELNISLNNTVKRICTPKESKSRLEALIKLVYIQLFKWLVNSLNKCYLKLINNKMNQYTNKCIGLLDMYGFEILNVNSFEQLCINYANEKLHQIFVDSHLKLIQEEFSNESIEWKPMLIDTAIDSIETKVFTILNEETMLRRDLLAPNQNQLLEKILQSNNMIKPNKQHATNSFMIKHYAGYVEYSIDDFIQKNKDHIPDDLIRFLMKSKNEFLHLILKLNLSNSIKIKKTVIDKFRTNLNNLIEDKLNKSHVYYIRCMRTNKSQQADMFDSKLIRKQMQACGIHSLIHLNKHFNYSHRFDYFKFNSKYYPLILNKSSNQINNTKMIIQQIESNYKNDDDYKLGKTKLFINETLLNKLNSKLVSRQNQSVIKIQSIWRMHSNRFKFKRKLISVIKIQNWYRRRLNTFLSKINNNLIQSIKSTTSTASTISLLSCSSLSN